MIQTLALLAVIGGAPAESPVTGPDRSLLRDGGSETSVKNAFDGWKRGNAAFVAESGRFGGREARDGDWFLRLDDEAAAGELRQRVDFEDLDRDAPPYLILSALVAVPDGQDTAELRLRFVDRSGNLLRQSAVRSTEKSWTELSLPVAVPKKATSVWVVVSAERRRGEFCDAFFDRIRLEPLGSDWPAAADVAEATELLRSGSDVAARSLGARALANGSDQDRGVLAQHVADMRAGPERDRLLSYLVAMAESEVASGFVEQELDGGSARARRGSRLVGLRPLDSLDVLALEKRVENASKPAEKKVFTGALCRVVAAGGKQQRAAEKALRRLLKNDPNRRAVLEALADMQPHEVAGSKNLASMVTSFTDPGSESREGEAALGIDALGAVSETQFLKALRKRLTEFESPNPMQRVFRRAVELQSEDAAEAMFDLLEDASGLNAQAFVRTAFGDTAHGFRSDSALSVLHKRGLESELPVVRLPSIEAFAGSGRLDVLVAAADDEDILCAISALLGCRYYYWNRPYYRVDESLTGLSSEQLDAALWAVIADGENFAAGSAAYVVSARADYPGVNYLALAEHPKPAVLVAGLASLDVGANGDAKFRERLVEEIRNPSRPVRVAAYRALGREKTRENVSILIARMQDETGTARDDLRNVLVAMTGNDRGADAESWSRWWDLVGADFDFQGPAGSDDSGSTEDRTVTAYHGIPITADKFAFVIDLSGSMRTKAGEVTRLERAKAELIDVLRSLREDQQFSLVGFGTEVDRFSEMLVEASPAKVEEAVRWVEGLTTRGWTNLFDGLESALLFEGVEAVYLLSDGGPSVGRLVDLDRILRITDRVNASLFVRIHTIVIDGSKRARWFLDELSTRSGGQSVEG